MGVRGLVGKGHRCLSQAPARSLDASPGALGDRWFSSFWLPGGREKLTEEVLQAAPQIHFVVAAGRDRETSHKGASARHLQTGCSQKPGATGRSIPKWTL